MSDYTKQSNASSLKMIDKIEIKHKPPKFEQEKQNNAEVSYVHKILDKVVRDLNGTFLTELNSILGENKNSLEQEKGKIDQLINDVGGSNTGLIKNLNDLQQKVKDLELKKSGGDDLDIDTEWQAEYFQNADNELITI